MILNSGTRLSRYEIRSKLGAGGMGEVYLARDLEIGRDVAVKVLPTTVSTNVELLRRFEQEANYQILNLLKSEVLYVFRSASFFLNSGRFVWFVW